MFNGLTDRWDKLKYHPVQERLWNSDTRFKIVHAGRRSGKTELEGKRALVKKAFIGSKYPNSRYGAAAPTRDQAKRIYWDDFKALIPNNFITKVSETELIIELINGSSICIIGMDKPERAEGIPWDHLVLDEYGNMKRQVWAENIRPALSDRKGSCSFIGVPEGRNHYYDLVLDAKDKEDWEVFHWPSSDILSPDEVLSAKQDLDELTFKQEYGGQFINFRGQCYYPFNRETHTTDKLPYNRNDNLIVCFDFNVSPGIAIIMQEQFLPIHGEKKSGLAFGTGIIDEIYIERNSNTEMICNKIVNRYATHMGRVICYGDATGGSRGTAKLKGSDWDIIRSVLSNRFGPRLKLKVRKSNPRERERVNAVNSRLKSVTGDVRLMVSKNCVNTIKDFEGVRLAENGEIEKAKDPKLTHITDAIGYYIAYEFPVMTKTKLKVR